MADNDSFPRDSQARNSAAPGSSAPNPVAQSSPPARRSGPDPVTLTAGVLALAVAIYVLAGGPWNLQWVLAVAAIGVGATMLVVSLRPRSDR